MVAPGTSVIHAAKPFGCSSTSMFHTRRLETRSKANVFLRVIFYFDSLVIPDTTNQTHDVVSVFQLHRSTEN